MENITLNEYVHEFFRTETEEGFWQIFYEPCDHVPVRALTGAIYIDESLVQVFHVQGERDIVVSHSPKKIKAINGHFSPVDGGIVLYWNHEPVEHFLCVSYEFDNEPIEEPKGSNWLTEGF